MPRYPFSLLKKKDKKRKKKTSHAREIGKIKLDIKHLKEDIQNMQVSYMVMKNGNTKTVFRSGMRIRIPSIPIGEAMDIGSKLEEIRKAEEKLRVKEEELIVKKKAYADAREKK